MQRKNMISPKRSDQGNGARAAREANVAKLANIHH
jgi:hypothetical protein